MTSLSNKRRTLCFGVLWHDRTRTESGITLAGAEALLEGIDLEEVGRIRIREAFAADGTTGILCIGPVLHTGEVFEV